MKLRLAVVAVFASLGGCGTAELFADYDVPEAPGTADAPWPRLVDTPTPPPPGVYTDAVPDPLTGVAVATELGIASRAAGERAASLPGPVVGDVREPRGQPEARAGAAALAVRARAAQERAERLSAPVLSEADRERLRQAVR